MSNQPLLQLIDIEKSFLNKRPVFSNVNISIERGEFLFLTGISGAGKSTIFKFLLGIEKPDSGQIIFNEKEINGISRREMVMHRRQIGIVFQDYKLLEKKNVAENIAIPLQIQGLSTFKVDQKVQQIAKRIGITQLLNQPVKSLSGGEQQLVAIARASIHSPLIILADEPTANLDQKMANKIIKMLIKLNESGTTVIIATHDIDLIRSHNRRILLIKRAKLVEVH